MPTLTLTLALLLTLALTSPLIIIDVTDDYAFSILVNCSSFAQRQASLRRHVELPSTLTLSLP